MKQAEQSFYKKLYTAVALLLLVQIIGIIGFIVIEDCTFAEAFYMTVIVVSTVGLAAVHELSIEGRVFIAVLIIVSIGIFTYAISILTSYFMEGEFRKYLKYRKVKAKIQKLSKHIIVCGYGRNGKQACEQLRLNNRKFVIVESNSNIINQIRNVESDFLFVEGDATHDEVLTEAGIINAEALITTLPDDADNVFVILTAKGINNNIKIISRASDDSSYSKIKRAGAENVVMPDKIGGTHMASLLANPDVLEFINVITGRSFYNLEELSFSKCSPRFRGMKLADIKEFNNSGVNIVGMKTKDGNYIVNPSGDTEITGETKLFILGSADQVDALMKLIS